MYESSTATEISSGLCLFLDRENPLFLPTMHYARCKCSKLIGRRVTTVHWVFKVRGNCSRCYWSSESCPFQFFLSPFQSVCSLSSGSWHKYDFCHDKRFVATNMCLLRQKTYLSRQKCLSRQNICRNKNVFIATNIFLSRQNFVATKHVFSSRQTHACRDKTFVMTKIILVAA